MAQGRSSHFFRSYTVLVFVGFLMTWGAELGAQAEPNS
mgnify:FL=1|jgi:hypothetical protein